MGEDRTARHRTGATATGSIAYWLLVGALAAFGVAAALTIGAFSAGQRRIATLVR